MTLNAAQEKANALTDDKFDSLVSELITTKFNYTLDTTLERKPKADKGV